MAFSCNERSRQQLQRETLFSMTNAFSIASWECKIGLEVQIYRPTISLTFWSVVKNPISRHIPVHTFWKVMMCENALQRISNLTLLACLPPLPWSVDCCDDNNMLRSLIVNTPCRCKLSRMREMTQMYNVPKMNKGMFIKISRSCCKKWSAQYSV